MRSFYSLSHDDSIGYVVERRECKSIQLTFSAIRATLCISNFEYLYQYIETIVGCHIPWEDKRPKTIALKIPYQGSVILLSELALRNLRYIERADVKRKTA